MSPRPTRATVEGRAYLDLQNLARRTGRATDELHQTYALEGFLDRMARSRFSATFVLKGGVLLAAFGSRRPTRDVDLAAADLDNDVGSVRNIVIEILAIDADDGIRFDLDRVTASTIRDDADYSGVRVEVTAALASAQLRVHIDVNVGDPVVPPAVIVSLPRILGGEIDLVGYPLEMVLAEKIVTAVQRGTANTRWRDFLDIYTLAGAHKVNGDHLAESIRVVAEHRSAIVSPLATVLDGYAPLAQPRWRAWRAKQQLEDRSPEEFSEVLDRVKAIAEGPLIGDSSGSVWDPVRGSWR